MNSLCEGCAFRPDTPASRSEEVRVDVMACALKETDFYCHEDLKPCRGYAAFKAQPARAFALIRPLVVVVEANGVSESVFV